MRPKLSPFMRSVLDIQDANLADSKAAARKGWAFLIRAVIAFWLSTLPMPHWAGMGFWCLTVVFGYGVWSQWERAVIARRLASIWPE